MRGPKFRIPAFSARERSGFLNLTALTLCAVDD